MTAKLISKKLDAIKSQVLHSLCINTYLSSLHKKLTTAAQNLKNLDCLNTYHPKLILNIEVNNNWNAFDERYDEFRIS